ARFTARRSFRRVGPDHAGGEWGAGRLGLADIALEPAVRLLVGAPIRRAVDPARTLLLVDAGLLAKLHIRRRKVELADGVAVAIGFLVDGEIRACAQGPALVRPAMACPGADRRLVLLGGIGNVSAEVVEPEKLDEVSVCRGLPDLARAAIA